MSHFDHPAFTRTARRFAALAVLAALLALGIFAKFDIVNHWGLTAIVSHFGQPNAPVGYHAPTAIIGHFGQPDLVNHT